MPRRNIPVRNPVAQSPLLRKGGPHEKSKTGRRVRARLSTNSAVDEWLDELEEDTLGQEQEDGGANAPPFRIQRLFRSQVISKEKPSTL